MSRPFRLRVSRALADSFTKEVDRPGYGPRKRAVWVAEALERLEKDDPGLRRVGLGDELDKPRDVNIGFNLSREAFARLESMVLRIRESAPMIEGVRALVIRSAIRHRVREEAKNRGETSVSSP
jgi:hypothetical protein